MAEMWLGYTVSVDCSDTIGCFQGQVSNVDSEKQTLSLCHAFQNGVPCPNSEVSLFAKDIHEISIITTSKVAINDTILPTAFSSKKPQPYRTLCENIGVFTNKNTGTFRESPRKNLADELKLQKAAELPRTPNKKERNYKKWADKDEACFGTPVDQYIDDEFDFEKNLALFDKQAVLDEISAQKPDILRQADIQRPQKYRHDENVLETSPTVLRQIVVPESDVEEYVTDAGLVVPSITSELRGRLFAVAEKFGLNRERQTEIIGRAATEMTIHLLGGSHRLNPNNWHQRPNVVILCGPHHQGVLGVNCGRQLASHDINVTLYIPNLPHLTPDMAVELSLFKMTKQKTVTNIKDLPATAVDIIVASLEDHELGYQLRSQPWYQSARLWVSSCRSPILSLDPPAGGMEINTKFSLVPAFPLSYKPQNGQIYLCNLGIPLKVFEDVGIKYRSPFGPKFVIPLHQNHD